MTLIARFDSFDTPILMGDFLISATNRPAGLKKKICRIGSNLAIGWTGHRLAAEIVIKQLDQYCCEHKISQSTLEEFFTTFNTADLCQLSVHIIGWLITDTENCPFLWNSEYPGELFYDHPIFDGTGADVVAQQVGSGFRGNFTDHTPLPDMPLTATLRVATELMKDEITDKINQTMGFGHAYEILYWNGERWEYLDNIAYLVITIRLNEQEIAESYEITGSIYKYSTHGEFAVTEHFRLKDNHHHISIITPPTVFDVNIVRNLRKKITDPRREVSYSITILLHIHGI